MQCVESGKFVVCTYPAVLSIGKAFGTDRYLDCHVHGAVFQGTGISDSIDTGQVAEKSCGLRMQRLDF